MVVVSGFLPVPLPMMIPFMGAQSLVIGKMFGEGFQYGKRKISAMPNEEFNKLTFQDMMSNARSEMQASIPTMQAALADMQPLVETVVHEFFDYIKQIAAMLPEESRRLTGGGELLTGSTGAQGTGTLNLTQAERDYLVSQSEGKSGDLLGDILVKLGLDRFGNQPAEAHQTGTTLSFPSTVSGLTVAQAQQRARDRQKAFEKERDRLRNISVPGRIALSKTVQPVPQLGRGRVGKKKAGQSQIFARTSMIRAIALNTKLLKAGGVSGKTLAVYAKRIRNTQQQLVNLLARYTF